jgi:hypothetical protein
MVLVNKKQVWKRSEDIYFWPLLHTGKNFAGPEAKLNIEKKKIT